MNSIETGLMIVCSVLAAALLVLLALYIEARVQEARRRERRAQERLRAIAEETQELDIVDAAFQTYQQSVADILDGDPTRRDELVRDLEAATAIWEQAEFEATIRPLRRDLAFWFAIRRAKRTKATT